MRANSLNARVAQDYCIVQASYCPGHLMFSEICDFDVWARSQASPSVNDAWLLSYMQFGAYCLGTLASRGLEARNYKAKNVVVKKNKFCCSNR